MLPRSQSIMTSVKIPKNLHEKILLQIIKDGYGMRGKNRWILESIELLITRKNFLELVEIAVDITSVSEILSIRIPYKLYDQMEKAVVTVRKKRPSLEAVKSHIIRASIIQRLLKSPP